MRSYAPAGGPQNNENPSDCSYLEHINWCRQTYEIRYRPHFVLISRSYQKPPSPNELLSKGAKIADITASVKASDKTAVCIVLKQRSNSRYYGKLCYLGKQMAVLSDK